MPQPLHVYTMRVPTEPLLWGDLGGQGENESGRIEDAAIWGLNAGVTLGCVHSHLVNECMKRWMMHELEGSTCLVDSPLQNAQLSFMMKPFA